MTYTAPRLIEENDAVAEFTCGNQALDDWLKNQAYKNQVNGASRTYVVCYDTEIVGYYSLATGSINRGNAPGKIGRNMPNPIPVIVLGRLAVDANHQGKGIGKGLIKDAVRRTLEVSEVVGVRALVVHAIDEAAKQFYSNKCGFKPSKIDEFTLLVTLKDIKKTLGI